MPEKRKVIIPDTMLISDASFSKCKKYRYILRRIWDISKPVAVFVCLNPSTADDVSNDNTVSKCIHFANAWNYGGLIMLDIFDFRATDPTEMKKETNPIGIGPFNDIVLTRYSGNDVGIIVVGWGNDGAHMDMGNKAMEVLKKQNDAIYCLAINKSGHPKHPLYVACSAKPTPYWIKHEVRNT